MLMRQVQNIAEFIAVVACSLFTGAAVYINLVEHPARMECGVEIATTEFAPSYHRAAVLQASVAALGLLSSVVAWVAGGSPWWLFGGVLVGSVIPFTLLVIRPTNKQLLDPALERSSEKCGRLLNTWGKLHAVRSFLSFAALLVFAFLLVFH